MQELRLFSQTETYKSAHKKRFTYPSEEETLVRRLGSALLAVWSSLPMDARERLRAEALTVWDREYHVHQLEKKIDTLINSYPRRLGLPY